MEYKVINHTVAKKDSQALVTGQPVYTDDLRPKDCLIVKALRSPHARAIVKKVNKSAAEKVPGIVCIVTADDVPQSRFTIAGQTYPELSRMTASSWISRSASSAIPSPSSPVRVKKPSTGPARPPSRVRRPGTAPGFHQSLG